MSMYTFLSLYLFTGVQLNVVTATLQADSLPSRSFNIATRHGLTNSLLLRGEHKKHST
jgi:hypothetical protein